MKLTSNPYAKLILARQPEDFAKFNCRVLVSNGKWMGPVIRNCRFEELAAAPEKTK